MNESKVVVLTGVGYDLMEEFVCNTCKGAAFTQYHYMEDHDYNMDWYQEGLTIPKTQND